MSGKMRRNMADRGRKQGMPSAGKVALAILGVGVAAGTTLVIGLDRIMKQIFKNEDWPDDDWSDEDLEG